MKKILMLAACTAAMTAITSCSSNDDDVLPQAPVAPAAGESVAETGGIPFSVNAFGDTRAIRYGDGGIGIGPNTSAVITEFKLYGKAASPSTAGPGGDGVWIPSYVFSRADADSPWEPNRDNDAVALNNKIQWGDTENATTFYAITDNSLGTASGNSLAYEAVDEHFDDGYVTYTVPYKEVGASEIGGSVVGRASYDPINDYITQGWIGKDWDNEVESFMGVDSTKMKDIMAAYATKTPTASDGTISLGFNHVFSGLAIKVKFPSAAWNDAGELCRIYAIAIHGLKIKGNYNFSTGTWSSLDYADKVYYKTFGHGTDAGIEVQPTAAGTKTDYIVRPGEWLFIPQEVAAATGGVLGFPSSGGYAEIIFYSHKQDEYGVGYIPFKLQPEAPNTIEAGNTYTLVLNLMKMYNTVTGTIYYDEDIFSSRLAK